VVAGLPHHVTQRGNRPDAPIPLLPLAQTAGPANPQDGKLYLSLRQAFKMALENNLDLQVEQIDQSIAVSSKIVAITTRRWELPGSRSRAQTAGNPVLAVIQGGPLPALSE
jgi:hypothetical protein